jgi:hypothetical protein
MNRASGLLAKEAKEAEEAEEHPRFLSVRF